MDLPFPILYNCCCLQLRWKLMCSCALPWVLITPNWLVLFRYHLNKLESAISGLCLVNNQIQLSQNKVVFWGSRREICSVLKRDRSQTATVFPNTAFMSYESQYLTMSSSQVSKASLFKAGEQKQNWNYQSTQKNPVAKPPYSQSSYVKNLHAQLHFF